jgi:hypothetical protein
LHNIRLSSEDRSASDIYLLRYSPLEKLDLEYKYRTTQLIDNDLNKTNSQNIYYTDGKGDEHEQG